LYVCAVEIALMIATKFQLRNVQLYFFNVRSAQFVDKFLRGLNVINW